MWSCVCVCVCVCVVFVFFFAFAGNGRQRKGEDYVDRLSGVSSLLVGNRVASIHRISSIMIIIFIFIFFTCSSSYCFNVNTVKKQWKFLY
jgi:hypothetical protein